MTDIDKFFQSNEKRLQNYTKKYKNKYNHNLIEDDIYQAAALGLAKAYYKKSSNISSKVKEEIMQEIYNHVYSNKVSPKVFKQYFKMIDEIQEMIQREYGPKEIYNHFLAQFSNRDIWFGYFLIEASFYFSTPLCIEHYYYNNEIIYEVYLSELKDEFNRIFYEYGILSEEEITVLRLLYGLDDKGERQAKEIAELLNVPDHRVRTIEQNALRSLRSDEKDSALLEYIKYWGVK